MFNYNSLKGDKMGKHIKTQLDYDMIEQFAKEILRLDPSNAVLEKYLKMSFHFLSLSF